MFQKRSEGSKTLDMTSEGLWEMFEGDFADTCAEKFLLMLMGGRVKCAQTVSEEAPIGVSGNH